MDLRELGRHCPKSVYQAGELLESGPGIACHPRKYTLYVLCEGEEWFNIPFSVRQQRAVVDSVSCAVDRAEVDVHAGEPASGAVRRLVKRGISLYHWNRF